MDNFLVTYGEASKTALGFFWKAGWAFVLVAALLIALHRRHLAASEHGGHDHDHDEGGGIDIQKYVAWLAILVLASGMLAFALLG